MKKLTPCLILLFTILAAGIVAAAVNPLGQAGCSGSKYVMAVAPAATEPRGTPIDPNVTYLAGRYEPDRITNLLLGIEGINHSLRTYFRQFLGDKLPIESEFVTVTEDIPDFLRNLGINCLTQLTSETLGELSGYKYTNHALGLEYTFSGNIVVGDATFMLTRIKAGSYVYSFLNRKSKTENTRVSTTYWREGDIYSIANSPGSVEALFEKMENQDYQPGDHLFFLYETTLFMYKPPGTDPEENNLLIVKSSPLNGTSSYTGRYEGGNYFRLNGKEYIFENDCTIVVKDKGVRYKYIASNQDGSLKFQLYKEGVLWSSVENYKVVPKVFNLSATMIHIKAGFMQTLKALSQHPNHLNLQAQKSYYLKYLASQALRAIVNTENFDITYKDGTRQRQHVRTNYYLASDEIGAQFKVVSKCMEILSLNESGNPYQAEYFTEHVRRSRVAIQANLVLAVLDPANFAGPLSGESTRDLARVYTFDSRSVAGPYNKRYSRFEITAYPRDWRKNELNKWVVDNNKPGAYNAGWQGREVEYTSQEILFQDTKIALLITKWSPGISTKKITYIIARNTPQVWVEFLGNINRVLGTDYDAIRIGRGEELIIDIPKQIRKAYDAERLGLYLPLPFTEVFLFTTPAHDLAVQLYTTYLLSRLLPELDYAGYNYRYERDTGTVIINPRPKR